MNNKTKNKLKHKLIHIDDRIQIVDYDTATL